MASHHRLGRGLQGYLILFDPHAFVFQSQVMGQQIAFAFGVPNDINGFHPSTDRSINPCCLLVVPFPALLLG